MENINLDVNAVLQTLTSQRTSNPAAVDRMFEFIRLVLNRENFSIADIQEALKPTTDQLSTISNQVGVIMADLKKMQDDVAATKANLDEARGDLAELSTKSDTLQGQVSTLEATVADLRTQLENAGTNTEALDALEQQIADLKTTSREIADVVPEAEPTVPTPAEPGEPVE